VVFPEERTGVQGKIGGGKALEKEIILGVEKGRSLGGKLGKTLEGSTQEP